MTVQPKGAVDLSSGRRWGLLLCLLLVAFMGVAQALHFHPNSFSNHENCVVCQVAHAPVATGPVAMPATVLTVAEYLIISFSRTPQRALSTFSLFCRPPPAV